MANPISEIWGAPSTWIYSKRQPGLETTAAKLGNFDKPKTANFGTGGSADFEGALVRAINVAHTMTLNEYLDESICPCGQAPDVSPFGKVALMNENKNFSTTPSSIYTTEKPVNWFFADVPSVIANLTPYVFHRDYGRLKYQQFAPKAFTTVNGAIAPMNLVPYVKYGLKTLVLSIEVGITANANNPITGAQIWVTLDDWKNNYSTTHYVNAMRLFVRCCTAINSTTLKLTYNNERNISTGQRGALAILNKFNILNDGKNVDTQFLALNRIAFSSAYIFDKTPEIFNEGGSSGANDRAFMPAYQYFENQTIEFYREDNTAGYYYYKIPYSESNYNKFMQIAALFGCFFTPTNKYAFDYDMLDNDIYLPILDDNGVGHGEYTNGSNNANNSLYSKNSIREIDYDPDAPTPHNHYYDHTDLPTQYGTAANWYTDRTLGYVDVHMNVGNLCNGIAALADNPYNKDFLFQEPLKNVLEYRRILLTQPWERAASVENIPLGAFVSQSPYPFTGYKNFPRFRRVTLGSFSFDREFNNFLDFEPYTQAVLYVPYCGVKHLPMNIFAGHTVNIYMNADNTSGVLQVLIFVDDIEWGTLTGMASEELPLVGETALTAANTKRELGFQQGQVEWQKLIGIMGSLAGASISAAQQNPAGVLTQGLTAAFKNYYYRDQQVELQYQINHTKPEPLTIQKGDSSIDKMNVQYPFIMIQNPVIIGGETSEQINAIMQTFGHTKGFKCCETGIIGDFSGLTKCSTANLNGISCTYTEKKMIMEALQEGVIL